MAETDPSYIDYETFLDPDFSPASFANSLVQSTNNATDTPLDLSTPLSRVLFDLQEIDTHIHTLTTRSALPLLTNTRDQTESAERILKETEKQVTAVTQGYERLEREVLRKWEAADEARVAAEKSLATVRLTRAVGRCLALGRQLESQLAEISGRGGAGAGGEDGRASPAVAKDDFRALERAAYTILNFRRMFSATDEADEGYGLDRVKIIRTLRGDLVIPAENMVKARAQQTVNRFSMSAATGGTAPQAQSSNYKQARDARARLVSAITALYILSPVPRNVSSVSDYQPELLLSGLQAYMQTAITSSLAAIVRALTMLPTLERTLSEVSAKCQDIVALESVLNSLRPPSHPLLSTTPTADSESQSKSNLLQPLLNSLDTSSLPSYFWRSLASSLTARVQELLNRGGLSTRSLKSNRDRLKAEIRDCVLRGSQLPAANVLADKGRPGTDAITAGNWEREAAVMVGSVVGFLGR
ncbi:exosome complex exonuclease Rrp6 [Aspergillus sclerotialis]|uniref:Conserved oligomeric Golgi complex subunit 5 n=1 Tax=Aspergillus sclerotialis TaxID=2070753 RepID=A0A3A2ZEE1_9EURO|nr:exosome complex exonuclease Rrp6 [Aspergillus sclerotialis]